MCKGKLLETLHAFYIKICLTAVMEISDEFKKPVLKKSDSDPINKGKKVTFCNTVKVFIDKGVDSSDNSESNCVEVNIVDKSNDYAINVSDVNFTDDCKPSDFLVHKVIYDYNIEHDDGAESDILSEETDESSVLFEPNVEEDCLEFIVHKVTDHEDDLIEQELEFENKSNENISKNIESDVIGKLSELSIENILTHDKIIALIDQKNLSLSSVIKKTLNHSEISSPHIHNDSTSSQVSQSLNSEITLSPPLQELSLDRIVKAQSSNILSELEISPLNSIQETDSDSDISSEGTMIMMTTEESEKTKQHIKESFLQYEFMKKAKSKEIIDNTEADDTMKSVDQNTEIIRNAKYSSLENNIDKICVNIKNDDSIQTVNDIPLDKKSLNAAVKFDFKEQMHLPEMVNINVDNIDTQIIDKDITLDDYKAQRQSSISLGTSCHWDTSLASIQIPKDVREWKIVIDSVEKRPHSKHLSSTETNYSLPDTNKFPEENKHCEIHVQNLDELENFVHESKERVQRLRKRYLETKTQNRLRIQNKHHLNASFPGKKPQFESTTKILQLVQRKNTSPILYSNSNHISWPCEDAFSTSDTSIENGEHFEHMLSYQNLSDQYSSFCSYFSEGSMSSTCDHDSVSSCPSVFFHERGVPEGASPPRSLSDDSIEQFNTENQNIVYFSMKV